MTHDANRLFSVTDADLARNAVSIKDEIMAKWWIQVEEAIARFHEQYGPAAPAATRIWWDGNSLNFAIYQASDLYSPPPPAPPA